MRVCGWCGVSIEHKRKDAKTCSRNCNYRLWVSRNPDRHRAITVKWQRSIPERWLGIRKSADSRRRARVRAAEVCTVTSRDWSRQVARQRGECFYCGRTRALTMDHVIPLSRGGRHSVGNIVAACLLCNSSKRARYVTEWRHRKTTLGAADENYNRFPAVDFLRS